MEENNNLLRIAQENLEMKFLVINLISKFFPLQKEDILKFKKILNFDTDYLPFNKNISWDIKLLEQIKSQLEWYALYKVNNIEFNLAFFKKYESYINFKSITYSPNIDWSNQLLDTYADKWDWSVLSNKPIMASPRNIKKYRNELDWRHLSNNSDLKLTYELIDEYLINWDWDQLSSNKALPVTLLFIKKYEKHLNFYRLSQNPSTIGLIQKYPKSDKWKWNNVIKNIGIVYTMETFKFYFKYFLDDYKKNYTNFKFSDEQFRQFALARFIKQICNSLNFDKDFFLKQPFLEFIDWNYLYSSHFYKFSENEIEEYFTKIDFKNIKYYKYLPKNFIFKNIDKLYNNNPENFYRYIPFEINWLKSHNKDANWYFICDNEKIEWSSDFLIENFNKLNVNLYHLGKNEGVYKNIISKYSRKEIIKFLENY